MKANEAPEKIYLQVCGDCNQSDCDNCKFEDFDDNITWCKDRIFQNDIEYICTDAFIEKAAEWIDETLRNTDFYENEIELMINDFKKAMKL